jgi:glycine dehydrogenase subunit 2
MMSEVASAQTAEQASSGTLGDDTPAGAGGAAPTTTGAATPMQREAAVTVFEKGAPGRRAFACPATDVPEVAIDELLPTHLRRAEPARLPELSEPEIVRHYVRLSRRNFDLDSGFYPLGSCTMKHNPRLHERVAGLAGHARLHPLQAPERAQGALELMWNLERALGEVAGLPHVCLQPSAGSHGELAGLLVTRAYHEDRGETRHKVLTPDTAHGTNPATVTMAGYDVVKVGTNPDGGVDLDDLRAKADKDVACLMLTNPNTLGIFDPNIEEISQIVHEVGATLYYDGANLNAVMGISRPGDMGFDIVHYNLHKSFTQPHGGGGPGSGPIAVSDRIAPYLPAPVITRDESADGPVFDLVTEPTDGPGSKSIGRLRGFQGNYGCFVRSYAYICSLGGPGLREASQTAVLNANYLLARLQREGVAEHLPLAFGKYCMHEFVLSGAPMKKELGLKTLDLAKRLLDHGFHPPTVYFPLLVDESLMIEPTETETKETLDAFADAIAAILREGAEDPEIARGAPYTTPVRRLDEAGAAKNPVIRQPLG